MSPAAKKSGASALKSQVNYFDSQWIPDMKEQWNQTEDLPLENHLGAGETCLHVYEHRQRWQGGSWQPRK